MLVCLDRLVGGSACLFFFRAFVPCLLSYAGPQQTFVSAFDILAAIEILQLWLQQTLKGRIAESGLPLSHSGVRYHADVFTSKNPFRNTYSRECDQFSRAEMCLRASCVGAGVSASHQEAVGRTSREGLRIARERGGLGRGVSYGKTASTTVSHESPIMSRSKPTPPPLSLPCSLAHVIRRSFKSPPHRRK